MSSRKYVGFDVHKATTSAAVRNVGGQLVTESVFTTNAESVSSFLRGVGGEIHLTFEEGTQAAWLFELTLPLVASVLVANPRKAVQEGSKSDRIDARKLSLGLYRETLSGVYHHDHGSARLKELVRSYETLIKDQTRGKNRLKALFRSRAIACSGARLYATATRESFIEQLPDTGQRERARWLYEQLEGLRPLVIEAKLAVRAEVRQHRAYPILMSLPGFGPVRTAQAIVAIKTPHRFRRDRQLWAYAGLSVRMHTSADYEIENGQMRRKVRQATTRGLVRHCNWQLKEVLKAAAETAIRSEPMKGRYERMVARGLKESIARVVVARQLATLMLSLWKKGECFDASRLAS